MGSSSEAPAASCPLEFCTWDMKVLPVAGQGVSGVAREMGTEGSMYQMKVIWAILSLLEGVIPSSPPSLGLISSSD